MKLNNCIRAFAATAAVAASLAAAPQANAVVVDSNGDSFTVWFYGNAGAQGILDATVKFTVTNFDVNFLGEDHVDFDVDINNYSTLATSRLTSFGIIDLTPTPTGADADSGWDTTINGNLSGTSVEVCLWDGQNCSGGGNDGVAGAGGAESFDLDLDMFFLSSDGLTLNGFMSKFQTAGTSYHLAGCLLNTTNCTRTPPTNVPEPATLALFSLGLLGVGFAARRRRKV